VGQILDVGHDGGSYRVGAWQAGAMADSPRLPSAGSAYLVRPDGDTGPGVLVLHAWWGLTPFFKGVCDRLADEGFVALAPDLLGGRRPETAAEAEVELGEIDPNESAALLLSSIVALRSQTNDPDRPVAVLGFSMGASWAMWLATRQPDSISGVVLYYGSQDMDFADLAAPVLGHFAETDDFVSEDELTFFEAQLRLLDKDVEIVTYPGTTHWFAEADRESFDEEAAAAAWSKTVEFLKADHRREPS
jgi:carboxymethylenebutenolidase